MDSRITSIRTGRATRGSDLTSSPDRGREVLIASSCKDKQPAASDTEQTSPQENEEQKEDTQIVYDSYPRDEFGPVEDNSKATDQPASTHPGATQTSRSTEMPNTSALASLMARRAGQTQPSSLNITAPKPASASKPQTTKTDNTTRASNAPAKTTESTKQSSRAQASAKAIDNLPSQKADNKAQRADQKQPEAIIKITAETKKAAKTASKRRSKIIDTDTDEASEEYVGTKKAAASRKPGKAKGKPKVIAAAKVEKPTRKQPRRSARGASDVPAEDENESETQEQKLSAFEKEVVVYPEDEEETKQKKSGATQQDPIELSDRRSPTPESESEFENAAPEAVKQRSPSAHPSSPPVPAITALTQTAVPPKPEQKPVVIAFGPQGPKNQGSRSDKKAQPQDVLDESADKTVQDTENSVLASLMARDVRHNVIKQYEDRKNSSARPAYTSNTATTVYDALDAFCLPKSAKISKAKTQPLNEIQPLKEVDTIDGDLMDIDDVLSPPAPAKSSSPAPDSRGSSPLSDLSAEGHEEAPKITVIDSSTRLTKKRSSEEAKLEADSIKKKARIVSNIPSTRVTCKSNNGVAKDLATAADAEPEQDTAQSSPVTKKDKLQRRGRASQPTPRLNSLGATSVDRDGSPIPPGIDVPKDATVLETYSQNISSPSSDVDEDVAMVETASSKKETLKPPPRQLEVLSSNSKPLPASPTRASQVITGANIVKLDRDRLIVRENSNVMPTDPFTKSNRSVLEEHVNREQQSGGKEQRAMLDTVLGAIAKLNDRFNDLENQRKTASPTVETVASPPPITITEKQPTVDIQTTIQETMSKAFATFESRLQALEAHRQSSPEVRQAFHAPEDRSNKPDTLPGRVSNCIDFQVYDDESDAERTLVEPDEPATEEDEDLPSLTSDHGSQEDETSPVTPNAPYTDLAMWRVSLKPYQIDIFDELVHASHRLMQHLVSKNKAYEDMLADLRRGGINLINQQEEVRRAAWKEDRDFVEGEKARLRLHFQQWHDQLRVHERKVIKVMEKMRESVRGVEDDESLEQQLLEYLDDQE